jgi:hypothetical protein
MYSADKRQKRRGIFIKFIILMIPFFAVLALITWLVFYRDTSNSASFQKTGAEVAEVKLATKDFTNTYFKITLPTSWADNGRQNPYSNQVYYEFQNTLKNYNNRWIRIYVDVFPGDFAINRLMPVSVVNNRIVPGTLSDDCTTFTGAPLSESGRSTAVTWEARWQNIKFICNVAAPANFTGTASLQEGYGITLTSKNGSSHKYFFVYIDHNAHPEYTTFSDALKSFETL